MKMLELYLFIMIFCYLQFEGLHKKLVDSMNQSWATKSYLRSISSLLFQ